MKRAITLFALVATMLMVGCGKRTQYGQIKTAQIFADSLRGENYVVKTFTAYNPYVDSEYVVIYDAGSGTYFAVDVHFFNPNSDSAETFLAQQDASGEVFWDLGLDRTTGDFIYSDPWGSIIFEETSDSSKDLEKLGAFTESLEREQISKNIVAEYGLSEARGQQLAKLVQAFDKIGSKRELTDADANQLVVDALGFGIEQGRKAFQAHLEGNDTALSDLVATAAGVNDSSPEHMNELVQSLLVQEEK